MTKTQINKIIQVQDRKSARMVWVGLGAPVDPPNDYTCPEITSRYVTKKALLAAIESGEAFR